MMKYKCCVVITMLSVVAVPAIAMLVFSSLLLYNSVLSYRQSQLALDELESFHRVDQLVTNLQVCTVVPSSA